MTIYILRAIEFTTSSAPIRLYIIVSFSTEISFISVNMFWTGDLVTKGVLFFLTS